MKLFVLVIFKAAFLPLQASKYSNLKISSLSKQFSFTKIQSFSFREEKCFFVWSYDKNISTFLLTQTYLYQLCHVRFDAEIHINRVTFTIRFELEVKTRTSNRDWKYNFLISIWRVIFEDCKNWAPNWPRQPVSTHLSRKNSWKHRWRPIQKTAWDFFCLLLSFGRSGRANLQTLGRALILDDSVWLRR